MKNLILLLLLGGMVMGCTSKIGTARENADLIMERLDDPNILAYFPGEYFDPRHIKSQLHTINQECDWSSRSGRFIGDYSWKVGPRNETMFFYEYFLDCDSLRMILSYDMDAEAPVLKRFNIEQLELPNDFITNPSIGILARPEE